MTPKEKADNLILKFMQLQEPNSSWFNGHLAKLRALIVANEVIDTLYEHHYDSESGAFDYWSEVKTQILN